jgi:hypothetical protein
MLNNTLVGKALVDRASHSIPQSRGLVVRNPVYEALSNLNSLQQATLWKAYCVTVDRTPCRN